MRTKYGFTYDGSRDFTVGLLPDPQAQPIANVWDNDFKKGEAKAKLVCDALNGWTTKCDCKLQHVNGPEWSSNAISDYQIVYCSLHSLTFTNYADLLGKACFHTFKNEGTDPLEKIEMPKSWIKSAMDNESRFVPTRTPQEVAHFAGPNADYVLEAIDHHATLKAQNAESQN